MKYLIVLLFFPLVGFSQNIWTDLNYPDVSFNDLPQTVIYDVEVGKDTLIVYKKHWVWDRNMSCMVAHNGTQCDWNDPLKMRDIYIVKKGKITLLETQTIRTKKVPKTVYETEEYWDN
jgi:hypothetical protein